jgi:hypothetical protein
MSRSVPGQVGARVQQAVAEAVAAQAVQHANSGSQSKLFAQLQALVKPK